MSLSRGGSRGAWGCTPLLPQKYFTFVFRFRRLKYSSPFTRPSPSSENPGNAPSCFCTSKCQQTRYPIQLRDEVRLWYGMKQPSNISPSVSWPVAGFKYANHPSAAQHTTTELTNFPSTSTNERSKNTNGTLSI